MGQCIIKFKAKRLGDGKWVEGYYVKKVAHNVVSKYDAVEDGEEHFIFGMAKDDVQPYWYEVDPSTVCQFTGLKDEDENDIFEGDLLAEKRFPMYEVGYVNSEFAASYIGENTFIFKLPALSKGCVVCGSIYDRKEGGK